MSIAISIIVGHMCTYLSRRLVAPAVSTKHFFYAFEILKSTIHHNKHALSSALYQEIVAKILNEFKRATLSSIKF